MSPVESSECRPPPAPAGGDRPLGVRLSAGRFALLLAVLVCLAYPTVAFGWRTFVFRDFGLFSYPVAFFARESFWHGQLPLWNPLSNCGLPFLAQWNTMVLYPPTLLYLLLPLSWALSFFSLVHLFWGGLGMYFLARRWTGFPFAGGVAGILFAFNGLSLNFLMWPSHVATFSWLPWVIWLGQEGWRKGGRRLAMVVAAGVMQMLAGGPETIAVTWVIMGLMLIVDLCSRQRLDSGSSQNGAEMKPSAAGGGSQTSGVPLKMPKVLFVARFAGMVILVSLICAAQLLPFLQLLAHSQRDSGYSALAQSWPMPIWGWANFLVPLFRTAPTPQGVYFQPQQYWTSSYYAGIGTIWLALVAMRRTREWRVGLLAGLLLLGMLLALGDPGLVYRGLLLVCPPLSVVRYPVKFVILVLAVAPLLAAYGMSAVVCHRRKVGAYEWGSAGVLLALVGFVVALSHDSGPAAWRVVWQNGLARSVFFIAEVLLVVRFIRCAWLRDNLATVRVSISHSPVHLGFLLLMVCYLDLLTQVPNQNPTGSPLVYSPGLTTEQFHWKPEPKLGFSRAMGSPRAEEALKYRAISDPEKNYLLERVGLLADCNLIDGVPQMHGFFSLTPSDINDVTAVPYVQTNRDFSALLDFMGVSQMTTESFECIARPSALPLVTAGQLALFADDQQTLAAFSQTNLDLSRVVFLPRSAQGVVTASPQPSARVRDIEMANQRVSFDVESPGPSLVVVAQTHYPAWKAYVDGKPVQIWRANYAFQAMEVCGGLHKVELRYEDRAFRMGMIMSIIGVMVWIWMWRSGRV